MPNKHILPFLFACGLFWPPVLIGSNFESSSAPPDMQPHLRAAAKGNLRLAAADGSYRGFTDFDESGSPSSLSTLIASSDVVALADTGTNTSHLTRDGLSILMTYAMRTVEVLKGRSFPAEWNLVVPGGRVGFPEGTWAQLDVREFDRPTLSARYLLFLRSAQRYARDVPTKNDLWTPAFGALGLYREQSERRVLPSGNWQSPFSKQLYKRNIGFGQFLVEVRELVNAENRWIELEAP